METLDGQGPPELVIKLAFQFLEWKSDDFKFKKPRNDIINVAPLACKRWKSLLDTEDIGRPLCMNRLRLYESKVRRRNEARLASGEEFEEQIWWDDEHELLARLAQETLPHGRTHKDMFILSQRLGYLIHEHKYDGPDCRCHGIRGDRSLREICSHNYHNLVLPTIQRLRDVFNEPKKSEREQDITAMKIRLLNHARSVGPALRRIDPMYIEKGELAENIGRYMVTLAATKPLDTNAFLTTSPIVASLEAIMLGIEHIIGEKISAHIDSEGRPVRKKLHESLGSTIWPMSPVDSLSFLIHRLWPNNLYDVDYPHDASQEQKDDMWSNHLMKWWLGLAEPIRKLLIAIHRKLSERFIDVSSLDTNVDSCKVPVDTVKQIVELDYRYVREPIAEQIWSNLDPDLREQIFNIYHQNAAMFYEMIRREYHTVYDDSNDLEHNAKILLDIFLEVPQRCADGPTLTNEYCDQLPTRMGEIMDRWNELIEQTKTDRNVLWNPQTLVELESFAPMWGIGLQQRYKSSSPPTLEFCIPRLVKAFLYQTLASKQQVPDESKLKRDVEVLLKDLGNFKEKWDNDRARADIQLMPESENINSRLQRILNDFRTLSTYIHTREHAMIALIPLLPNLSEYDAKRLVYAVFIEQHKDNMKDHHEMENLARGGFSESNMNFGGLWTEDIPVAKNNDNDATLLADWSNKRHKSYQLWNEDGTLSRLFGLPLSENIISAMGQFMVENLYQQDIDAIDTNQISNAFGVLRFLRRCCSESPNKSHIVLRYVELSIQNAVSVLAEHISVMQDIHFDPDDEEAANVVVNEKQRENFQRVAQTLLVFCIETRAKSLIPTLRTLYDGPVFDVLPDNIISFESLVKKMEENTAGVIVDTKRYHSIRGGDREL